MTTLTLLRWPTLVTWPGETYLETVEAPDHTAAIATARRIYQGAENIQVLDTPVSHSITAPAEAEPEPTLPAHSWELAALLDDGMDDDALAVLTRRMEKTYGADQAERMLEDARAQIAHEHRIDTAMGQFAGHLDLALVNLGAARAELARLADENGEAAHVEYAEGTTGADQDRFLADAERAVRAVIALDEPIRRFRGRS